ncbi:hypothetical protein NEISICOT_01379 [Neisseria sicca ATCC 29256]|uniref:Uncharacterized protein n=1 Tax=Neisseria sicca ATCC 29256 TaxID=547045 RepID=C6M4D3_NEISI|nr:hypothetical protein NEISICOT_01379 [Neisseria sicca ATCC 29256]
MEARRDVAEKRLLPAEGYGFKILEQLIYYRILRGITKKI